MSLINFKLRRVHLLLGSPSYLLVRHISIEIRSDFETRAKAPKWGPTPHFKTQSCGFSRSRFLSEFSLEEVFLVQRGAQCEGNESWRKKSIQKLLWRLEYAANLFIYPVSGE